MLRISTDMYAVHVCRISSKIACLPIEDSDQLAHPGSLSRALAEHSAGGQ